MPSLPPSDAKLDGRLRLIVSSYQRLTGKNLISVGSPRPPLTPCPLPEGEGVSTGPGVRDANKALHAARKAFDPIAERIKGLIKQVDLLYKLASCLVTAAAESPSLKSEISNPKSSEPTLDFRGARKLAKDLDEQRRSAVDQLKHAIYFHRHIVWLQNHFPDAELQPVLGLVKVVTQKEIESAEVQRAQRLQQRHGDQHFEMRPGSGQPLVHRNVFGERQIGDDECGRKRPSLIADIEARR